MKRKKLLYRWFFYIIGMLILALGLTLNTTTNFGTAPVISIPYTLSFVFPISFANMTLIVYTIFVILEFFLKGDQRQWIDILQIPFSIVFTRFIDIFSVLFDFSESPVYVRILILATAVILTGCGSAMTLLMNIIANPGDGFVLGVSIFIKKELGTAKNILDIFCVAFSITVSLVFVGRLVGFGLGTIISMIFMGRVIALFNHLFKDKLTKLCF